MVKQLGIPAIESSCKDNSVKNLRTFKNGLHPVTVAKKVFQLFMERQGGQNQAKCDDRRLFERRSKDDLLAIIQKSNQIYLGQKIP